jgi:hypothetical protein
LQEEESVMRCDEVRERFVELLYDEAGTPRAGSELKGHILACPECRRELESLKRTRTLLGEWKDEAPDRPFRLPVDEPRRAVPHPNRFRIVRYAAIAAMLVLSFLSVANMEVRWDKNGFAMKTSLFSRGGEGTYSKAEVRDLVKSVVDDSEARTLETNYLMMQNVLEKIEQERWQNLRLVRQQSARSGEKN